MPAPEVGKQGSEIELIYFVKIRSVWNFLCQFFVSIDTINNIWPTILNAISDKNEFIFI